MASLLQKTKTNGFLRSESRAMRSRAAVYVDATSGDLQAGTVLGRVTATGKYVAWDSGASDGSEVVAGILMEWVPAIEIYTAIIIGDATVKISELNYTGTEDDLISGLAAIGCGTLLSNAGVPSPAPRFTTNPSISDYSPDAGDTVTVSDGVATGDPTPTLTGVLTLNGVDVTGAMVGMTYTIPGGTADGVSLIWTVTATNSEGSAVRSVTAIVSSGAVIDPVIASWFGTDAVAPYADLISGHELTVGAGAPSVNVDGFGSGKNSITFNGTTDYLVIDQSDIGDLNIGATYGNEVTVLAWTKRSGATSAETLDFIAGCWQEDDNDPRRQYGLFQSLPGWNADNRTAMHISKSGGATPGYIYARDIAFGARQIPRGETVWRFHAGTYDGSEIRAYLDAGFEPLSDNTDSSGNTWDPNPYPFTDGLNTTPSDFTVGSVRITSGMSNHYSGEIAEVRVYNRALTHEEIRDIYLAEIPSGQSVYFDPVFIDGDDQAPAWAGYRSYIGATAVDKSYVDPDDAPYEYTWAGVSISGGAQEYITRDTANSGQSLCYYPGFLDAPLPKSAVSSISWLANHASTTDGLRAAIRVDGQWYVASSPQQMSVAGIGASDWTNAEVHTTAINATASEWNELTFVEGVTLVMGSTPSSDIDFTNGIEAFGWYQTGTNVGNMRLRDITVSA